MPIESDQPSPHRVGETTRTWSYCRRFVYDHDDKVLEFVYPVYADAASAYSGGLPQGRVEERVTGDDFDALVAQHAALFAAVMDAIDNYMITRQDFAGGVVVPPGPPSESED